MIVRLALVCGRLFSSLAVSCTSFAIRVGLDTESLAAAIETVLKVERDNAIVRRPLAFVQLAGARHAAGFSK